MMAIMQAGLENKTDAIQLGVSFAF